ncbi:MAG: TrkH family potassium uptake protein [Solobacterium sp.]|nr:TrkH family potassium uptake protein [Solobacterium sp.]
MNEPLQTLHLWRRRLSPAERLARSNRPEKLLLYSFLALILTGSFLLNLPIANLRPKVPYLDNLFVAVSAVCVTGLSTVTVAEQYSLFGRIVLILLMQAGGLGPMTIIAVLMQQTRRRMDTVEKKLFAATAGKSDLYDVPRYIRRIMLYTIVFEGIGFVLLSLRMTQIYGMGTGLFNALFLAVSAFTNAGFDCIASDSLVMFAGDPLVNMTVMLLIVTGGLGFVVWFELYDLIKSRLNSGNVFRRRHRYLSVHARIVLKTTAVLLVLGTVLFAILEGDNSGTLASMGKAEGLLACMFQSVTLRTAGFATVVIGRCSRPTLLLMCGFMLVGGSPGGTAGGIKTTTAAVLYATARNSLNEDKKDAVVEHRRISPDLLKHAFMILSLYVGILYVAIMLLCIFEPGKLLLSLIFEAFSAIATVGISTGITASLSTLGKAVIMVLMFIGRLGPLSLYTAFHKAPRARSHASYPDADIIIG